MIDLNDMIRFVEYNIAINIFLESIEKLIISSMAMSKIPASNMKSSPRIIQMSNALCIQHYRCNFCENKS